MTLLFTIHLLKHNSLTIFQKFSSLSWNYSAIRTNSNSLRTSATSDKAPSAKKPKQCVLRKAQLKMPQQHPTLRFQRERSTPDAH